MSMSMAASMDTAMDKWTYRHMVIWTYGHMGMWTYGHLDTWTYRRMDMWTYGHNRDREKFKEPGAGNLSKHGAVKAYKECL